jgi:hypothetical protein
MNFGAIRVFSLRALQLLQIELVLATFLKTELGINFGVMAYVIGGVIMLSYVALDILVIFPQEQEYSLKRNKEFQRKVNGI